MTNNLMQNDKFFKKSHKKTNEIFFSQLTLTRLIRHSRHEIEIKK